MLADPDKTLMERLMPHCSGDKTIFPLLRYYTVFNVAQCEGIAIPTLCNPHVHPIAECERIVAGMPNPPKIEFGGNKAFYVPSGDLITLPVRERFNNAEEFYSTMLHEMVHSTGHVSRLNRKGINKKGVGFGSQTYSHEELVAELGASFLNAKAGISASTLSNSASYIANWISVLRRDSKMLIAAAGAAQKAADYILNVQTSSDSEK